MTDFTKKNTVPGSSGTVLTTEQKAVADKAAEEKAAEEKAAEEKAAEEKAAEEKAAEEKAALSKFAKNKQKYKINPLCFGAHINNVWFEKTSEEQLFDESPSVIESFEKGFLVKI